MDEKVRQRQALFELREKTLGQILDETVARIPDKEAIVYADRNYRQTWREFADTVDLFAKGLMALGVQKGEKVAVWASNVPYWVTLQFATAKIGAILITVNTNYREHELEYLLNQSECENIFIMDSLRDHDYIDTLYTLAPELRYQSRDRLSFARLPHLRRVCFLGAEKHRGMYSVPEILSMSVMTDDAEYQARQDSLDPWDAINMQYTSGTTGFPKGVMLTHVGVGLNGYWIGRNQRFTDEDRVCLPVPLFHCFGCVLGVMSCVNHGATMVFLEKFDPVQVMTSIEREKCTATYGVPTMYIAMLDHPLFNRFDFRSLRTGIMSGSACPTHRMQQANDKMFMREITNPYGLTESGPVMTMTRYFETSIVRKCQTIGQALPGIEVAIIDPDSGEIAPIGQDGEICCRGFNTMKGYYKMPEQTAKCIDKNGWLHSGDIGKMDADGYYYITGRLKDLIIRGGENISPKEVEDFLGTMPGVQDVAVVGCPSKKYGEQPAAFIIRSAGSEISEHDVAVFCKDKISWFKIPKYVHFLDVFPMTASQKIQKYKLREMAAQLWPEA